MISLWNVKKLPESDFIYKLHLDCSNHMHKVDCYSTSAILYPVFTFNSARGLANIFFISFLCHLSLIPEVYKIETGNSELFGEFGSQEHHSFVLGNNPSNGSDTAIDLIQKLYMLFSTGELVMNDKEEAHSEEMPALADGKQQDKKGNLGYNRIEAPEVPLFGFFP